jgi:hypothetical protein
MRAAVHGVAMAAALWLACPAQAQVTFDVIGPHEYDLPVNFDPFNVFVQYGLVQNDSEFWDENGDRVAGSGARRVIGLSKYVHFWTPDFNRNIGLAWEVIQPEVSIRDRGAVDPDARNLSGFGDTLTGFAAWFKPTPKSTLGIQSFLQIPWGDKDVSDTNWKNLTSLLWYTPLGWEFDWTGDAGFTWQSPKADGVQPGTTFYTNNRFGYRVNQWLEPFVALDYEHIDSYEFQPEAWAFDGGLGLMVFTYEGQSITARYSTSLKAQNHTDNNSWNLKYVYTW